MDRIRRARLTRDDGKGLLVGSRNDATPVGLSAAASLLVQMSDREGGGRNVFISFPAAALPCPDACASLAASDLGTLLDVAKRLISWPR